MDIFVIFTKIFTSLEVTANDFAYVLRGLPIHYDKWRTSFVPG